MPIYRDLFIDLDGTLWNFNENSKAALRLLYDKYHLSNFFDGFDEFYKLYRERNDYLWTLYAEGKIKRQDLEKERFEYPFEKKMLNLSVVAQALQAEYLPLLVKQNKLEPGAVETLDYLKSRGYRLYIVSNGFKEVQYKKLQGSGISAYFDDVFLSENIGVNKPDARFFAHIINKTGAKTESSMVIGDNFRADIVGARNFGIDQVFYEPGFEQTYEFVPTYTIKSLLELKNIL